MSKTFVFGDIHGCSDSLLNLLDKIAPNPDRDFLIFLGDYIDRGPESMAVIDEILALRSRFRHLIALKGNHEQMFLDCLAGKECELFLRTGGEQTLKSYGIHELTEYRELIPPAHLDFLHDLLSYWEDDDYIYVHAGLRPGVHITQQSTDWLFWARNNFINSAYDFGKRVVFGHTSFKTPLIETNKIGIDTGAVYGGRLTCLILPDLGFVSVPGWVV